MRRSRNGFTLIEMLTAIAIASVLMTVGVGVFLQMNRSTQIRGEAARVAAVISSTRNSAVISRAPAVVNFTVDETTTGEDYVDWADHIDGVPIHYGTVFYGIVREPVAMWHFEQLRTTSADGEPLPLPHFAGSRGYQAIVKPDGLEGVDLGLGDLISTEGRVGKGLYLPEPFDGQSFYLEIGQAPSYVPVLNLRDGIAISAWVNPSTEFLPPDDKMPIVTKWDAGANLSAYALSLVYSLDDQAYRVVGEVRTASGAALGAASYARVRPGEWTHVSMMFRFDPVEGKPRLTTFVNGQEDVDDFVSGDRVDIAGGPIVLSRGPVRIGGYGPDAPLHAGSYYVGRIDELEIAAFTRGERQKMSGRVGFVARNLQSPEPTEPGALRTYSITFDRSGRLATVSGGMPEVLLYSALTDSTRRVCRIRPSLLGTVEFAQWEEGFDPTTRTWKITQGIEVE